MEEAGVYARDWEAVTMLCIYLALFFSPVLSPKVKTLMHT